MSRFRGDGEGLESWAREGLIGSSALILLLAPSRCTLWNEVVDIWSTRRDPVFDPEFALEFGLELGPRGDIPHTPTLLDRLSLASGVLNRGRPVIS
jgi:hypothetical protein